MIRGARLLLVGLAPAAHGGNRTGRVFTGDRSGDFLFASLYRTGFANQPSPSAPATGSRCDDAYVAAAVRCAPPANKPTPAERDECMPYLVRELELLDAGPRDRRARRVRLRGDVDGVARRRARRASSCPRAGRGSRTGSRCRAARVTVVGAFHPSQQNTFTGRLTPTMLDAVFARALASSSDPGDDLADARRSPR